MCMRISSVLALPATLAACGQQPATSMAFPKAEAIATVQARDNTQIACAVAGSSLFSHQCTVQSAHSTEGRVLTLRRPDGGFHRLLIEPGIGVVAADGAQAAKVVLRSDGQMDVAIGRDRYRLAATPHDRLTK